MTKELALKDIEKRLLSLASDPLFPATAVYIVTHDLQLQQCPCDPFEQIVSFEAVLLYFLIATNKIVDLSYNHEEILSFEPVVRKILKELEHLLLAPSTIPRNSTSANIIKKLEEDMHSPLFVAASFLYSGDEAFPAQYIELIPQRYKFDEKWLIDNIKINLKDLVSCMLYLILQASQQNCQQRIAPLLIPLKDVPLELIKPMKIFIEYFSTNLGDIKCFALENILQFQARPILKIDNDNLLLPPPIILMQAVCESPLYWMIKDTAYSNNAWQHRGETTVDMVFQWIKSVFGENNVFKNVLIKRKNQDVTDIDVLVIFQNKAIIFQIKSKKVTLKTKLGDLEQFKTDFSKSIQEAYNQAILSIESIKNKDSDFILDKKNLQLPSCINDYYIFCITTEQFKTLNMRLNEFLKESDKFSSIPIFALSTFDLQILALYLNDPYDFLYYLHYRKRLKFKISFSEEINVFSAFLASRLRNISEDKIYFANDFLDILNEHFQPFPTREDITNSYLWKRQDKEDIISSIKNWDNPLTNDLISYIYDYYEELSINMLIQLNRMDKERVFQLLKNPLDLLATLKLLTHKIGRNEKCPCGSGLKYKYCCGK